jgi:hypothetical protein
LEKSEKYFCGINKRIACGNKNSNKIDAPTEKTFRFARRFLSTGKRNGSTVY